MGAALLCFFNDRQANCLLGYDYRNDQTVSGVLNGQPPILSVELLHHIGNNFLSIRGKYLMAINASCFKRFHLDLRTQTLVE